MPEKKDYLKDLIKKVKESKKGKSDSEVHTDIDKMIEKLQGTTGKEPPTELETPAAKKKPVPAVKEIGLVQKQNN